MEYRRFFGVIESTPANIITLVRICLIPVFVYVFIGDWPLKFFSSWATFIQAVISLILYILLCLTDTLDGYLARSRKEITTFGKFIDPIADKVFVTAVLLCLVQIGMIPAWIPIIIIAREFLVSGLRLLVAPKGVVVAASILGKVKTATTMIALGFFILMTYEPVANVSWFSFIAWAMMTAAVVLTLASAFDYCLKLWPYFTSDALQPFEQSSSNLEGNHPDAAKLIALLTSRKETLCTAESCTSGLLCAALTSVPGSSEVIRGAAVTYMVCEKERALGVSAQTIETYGVVSPQTASEMARGAQERLDCTYAISTTGIAGPGPSEDGVPQGHVCFAISRAGSIECREFTFAGTRTQVRAQAVDYALSFLLEYIGSCKNNDEVITDIV